MKILICGLPGSGKTTLAKELAYKFHVPHHNADTYREMFNDWDFSIVGRLRQAQRMAKQYGILDFVCPTNETRELVEADFTIWMDTIEDSRYEDTNKVFVNPENYNVRITSWIDINQLHSSWEDFSPGTKGILSYLEERLPKLVK